MGCRQSKQSTPKVDKDQNTKKMFRVGGELGKGGMSFEANLQIGYMSEEKILSFAGCRGE